MAPLAERDLIVKAPPRTSAGERLYLTGEGPELCAWNPACVPAAPLGDGTYRVRLPAGVATPQFKITRGDWSSEAADAEGRPLANLVFDPADPVVNLANWVDRGALGVTGQLVEIPALQSPQLGNRRDVHVWLPPGYDDHPNERYPVVYAHDGQNLFNPRTSTWGVDWELDETLTELIASGELPPAIVVGIDSLSASRMAEYDETLRGRDYARFVVETVKPLVDTRFRTQPERESTFTMGSSMGAVIALELVWMHPEVFSAAAGVSAAVFANRNAIYRTLAAAKPTQPVRFYVDHGDRGGDAGYAAAVRPFCEWLRNERGFTNTTLTCREFAYADHTELDWARRAATPLAALLRGR